MDIAHGAKKRANSTSCPIQFSISSYFWYSTLCACHDRRLCAARPDSLRGNCSGQCWPQMAGFGRLNGGACESRRCHVIDDQQSWHVEQALLRIAQHPTGKSWMHSHVSCGIVISAVRANTQSSALTHSGCTQAAVRGRRPAAVSATSRFLPDTAHHAAGSGQENQDSKRPRRVGPRVKRRACEECTCRVWRASVSVPSWTSAAASARRPPPWMLAALKAMRLPSSERHSADPNMHVHTFMHSLGRHACRTGRHLSLGCWYSFSEHNFVFTSPGAKCFLLPVRMQSPDLLSPYAVWSHPSPLHMVICWKACACVLQGRGGTVSAAAPAAAATGVLRAAGCAAVARAWQLCTCTPLHALACRRALTSGRCTALRRKPPLPQTLTVMAS